MYIAKQEDVRPIETVEQLHSYFEHACKPRSEWLIGTEYEIMGMHMKPGVLGKAPSYTEPGGIRALMETLNRERRWSCVYENDYIIALTLGRSQITFEPGGQFELAAKPVAHANALEDMLNRFFLQLAEPSRNLDLAWVGMGFRPFGTREEIPWMPKERYAVMREYMPKVGNLGLDMMKRTGTAQVNLDFSDAGDAHDKLRAIMSVTSLLTAIYANSPIVDGADSGYQSYRAHVWTDTDPARCGLLDFAFDDGNIFELYTEYALDVPMYFVYRGNYVPAGGMTFRQFMRDGFQGYHATGDDWALHLSTLFPESRMKKLIEVRGCDCGSRQMVLALGPLCKALFYDDDARRAAIELTASLTRGERHALVEDVARQGLRARAGANGPSVHELARELVSIASAGLARQWPTEMRYLEPVQAIVESGRTQADDLLDLWKRTGGDHLALINHVAHYGA